MNVTAHQKKNENPRKRYENKRKDRIPILERVRAALLQSFRGKICRFWEELGVSGTLGKTNCHFDQTQWGREPHHLLEAAVDW